MPTITDVAMMAGVSAATVSRVLNKKLVVRKETEERVWAAIEVLGYQPDGSARALVTGKTAVIGVIISTIENPFFATVVRGIESKVYEEDYSLMLFNTDGDPQRERMYLRLLRQKRADGLIVSTSGGTEDEILASVVRKSPVVLLNRRLSEARTTADMPVDTVLSNSREGVRMAIAHLIEHGHRRIGIVAGPVGHLQGSERLEGYRQALADAGISASRPELITIAPFTEEGGYTGTMRVLNGGGQPTALFVSNNLMALGAMKALRELGCRVPDDLAFISFDDIDWAPFVDPPLTTVTQLAYQIGVTSANILLGRLSGRIRGGAKEALLPTKLVVRASCGSHKQD